MSSPTVSLSSSVVGNKEKANEDAKVRKYFRKLKENLPLIMMVLPGFILLLLFAYLPMFGIVIAFKKINLVLGIWGSPWNGFENFKFMFSTPDAWVITRNTIAYNLVFIFLGLLLNVSLAVALNEVKNKIVSKTYQTIILMPHFLSFVIVSYLVLAFFNNERGFINTAILPVLGMEQIDWYTKPNYWPWILTFVHFWKSIGYGSIVYMAAIAGIEMQLYEAARIDGANRFQQIIHITIPSLTSLMIIMTIMNVGKIFNADFGLFYQVPRNQGALYPVTNVISTYVYNMLMGAGSGATGMASAASFYQSIVGFVLVVVTNGVVKKIDPEKSMF